MTTTSFVYKVCIVGDAGVGKTSVVVRWSQGWFRHAYISTVGVQHYSRTIDVEGKEGTVSVKLIIWDLAGDDSFKEIRANFYDGAMGLVAMFDLTRADTFRSLPRWIQEAVKSIRRRVPFIVVGNKADLQPFAIDQSLAERYASSIGSPFIATSAKTGSNVADLFEQVGKLIHEKSRTGTARTGRRKGIE